MDILVTNIVYDVLIKCLFKKNVEVIFLKLILNKKAPVTFFLFYSQFNYILYRKTFSLLEFVCNKDMNGIFDLYLVKVQMF